MQQFDLITYLTQWGPTVLILGYGFKLMHGMYRRERNKVDELQNYIITCEKETLNVLFEIRSALRNMTPIRENSSGELFILEESEEFEEINNTINKLIDKISNTNI